MAKFKLLIELNVEADSRDHACARVQSILDSHDLDGNILFYPEYQPAEDAAIAENMRDVWACQNSYGASAP